jgi:hypothetical protein
MLTEDHSRRCNGPLFSLPNRLILKIAQHLNTRDCTRLVRVSHRYYPLITDRFLHRNIRTGESSLILLAAKRDLTRMARRLLRFGADFNTRHGSLSTTLNRPMSPLLVTARQGSLKVATILLEFEVIHSKTPSTRRRVQDMSHTLYYVLQRDFRHTPFIRRELHQDVYEIVLMLLHCGADPDAQLHNTGTWSRNTARAISSRHLDPRIRALLMNVTQPEDSKKHELQVGRSWSRSSQIESPVLQHIQLVGLRSKECVSVKLSNLFKRSNAGEPMNASSGEYTRHTGTDYGSSYRMRSTGSPSLSFFPPRNASNTDLQYTSQSSQSRTPLFHDLADTPHTGPLEGMSRRTERSGWKARSCNTRSSRYR